MLDPDEIAIDGVVAESVEPALIDEAAELEGDARALYETLPVDGSTRSNPQLREALGWHEAASEERYFSARDQLEDLGLIVRGRGRGGTVRRVVEAPVVPPGEILEPRLSEDTLYEPLRKVISDQWAKTQRQDPVAVEITARQGRRRTGIWARPDLVSIEVRGYEYVPGKSLEVTTFEVKASDSISVQAVYEALAHRRAATRSYVVLHVPTDQQEARALEVDEVCEVAKAHGIGVITVEDPADYETWDEKEVAVRVEPDPATLDDFVAKQLSEGARRAIRRLL